MMRVRCLIVLLSLFVCLFGRTEMASDEQLSLWYRQPAENWVMEALPIGNGNMGAMLFGGVSRERVQFNEKTLWRGSDKPNDLGSYLSFGDLYISDTDSVKDFRDYIRMLNLRRGVASVSYETDSGRFRREYLASFPDGVTAIRYEALDGNDINVKLQLVSAQNAPTVYTPDGASFSGVIGNGMLYYAAVRVETVGGSVRVDNDGLEVNNASEMTIFLACATDFAPGAESHLSGLDPAPAVNAALEAASAKGFARVRQDHIDDYSSLFGRVDFELSGAANDLPTDSLLHSDSASHRSMTDKLVFDYGRYLIISSSRGLDVPSNLQGIWNKDGNATSSAVWASDIHANINVQMNYWPVESTNLSECHLPLLNFMFNEAQRPGGAWQRNARELGVDEGWVVNTAGNIFGGSSGYKVGKYSVANAWLCDHLWQHFSYTLDRDFLRDRALPLMKSASRFWLKRLVPAANGDGTLECPSEYSPEQGDVQNATAHSQQLVTMLFVNSIDAIDVIGNQSDRQLRDSISDALSRLDSGLRVDCDGLLREWKYQENTPNQEADRNYFADDEANVWKGHRHTSHLVGLYPGFLIAPEKDPGIFDAAVASLNDRGDLTTGWARAWRIALWARARNPRRAYSSLRGFVHPTRSLTYDWHGGLYDNLLDAHATSVFQIEGNLGATAAIAEMLLQSSPDSLILLPALPEEWADGSIRGLKAKGNFCVDMKWAAGRLSYVRIKSLAGAPLTVSYPGIGYAEVEGADPLRSNPDSLSFDTEPGKTYTLTLSY